METDVESAWILESRYKGTGWVPQCVRRTEKEIRTVEHNFLDAGYDQSTVRVRRWVPAEEKAKRRAKR